MFGCRRLAKEEYALMGGNPVWLLDDAVHLLTLFEMEVTGAFGESDELISIDRVYSVIVPQAGVEATYGEVSSKWDELLNRALWDGDILYSNIPKRGEQQPDLPNGAGNTITETGSFERDELLRYLVESVESGELQLDLKGLHQFLSGKGTAPSKEVKIVKEPMSKEDMASGLSSDRNPIPKSKVKDYVEGQLKAGCTCWHTRMRDRVWDHFADLDMNDDETPEKEKVSVKLTKAVVLKEVRTIYKDKGIEKLVFNLRTHGGQRNECSVHSSDR